MSSSGFEFLTHARQRGRDAEVLEVGAGVEGGLGREVGGRDLGVEAFGFEVDLQDGFAVLLNGEVDEEAAGQSAEGGFVEIEGAVGGDHDEGGELRHAVPFAEELVDQFAVAGAVGAAGAGAEDGVGFVDEDDAGRELFGEGEDGPDVLFAFADVHVVDIWDWSVKGSKQDMKETYYRSRSLRAPWLRSL